MGPSDAFLREAIELFKRQHGITTEDLLRVLQGPAVPVSAFSGKHTILETVCAYLRDAHDLDAKRIAGLLDRPTSTIYNALRNADRKGPVEADDDLLRIPAGAFSKDLTPTEAVIRYMVDELHIANAETARLLGRDPRNTHKQLLSAREKLGGGAS